MLDLPFTSILSGHHTDSYREMSHYFLYLWIIINNKLKQNVLVWESIIISLEMLQLCVWEMKIKANAWLKSYLHPQLHFLNQKIFYGPFSKTDILTFLFLCEAILTKAVCLKLLKRGQKLDEMYSKSSSY